jgi:hypothetical protein
MIVSYRSFRNSIMIVYDINKSAFGLNPIMCYRFSESAIKALNLNDLSNLTDKLVQDTIVANKLSIEGFFEEVPMKIHRSHLLQAFLFDHIQPHMPAFNTQAFNLGSSNNYFTHHIYKATGQSQAILEEFNRIEGQHKKMMQQAKKNNKKIQQVIMANKDKTVKGSLADKEEREALENVRVTDDQDNKMEFVLLSKQIDQLYSSISELDGCVAN